MSFSKIFQILFIIGSTFLIFIPECLKIHGGFSSSFSDFEDRRRVSLKSCPFSWRFMVLASCHPLKSFPIMRIFPYPLSFASLDTHGNGIAESSWLTDYYNNSCRYRLWDDHDARAMLACLEFFFCFLFDQGIGSRSAASASRVDVVWVSVCVSSVVGCWSYGWCTVVFEWHCMPYVCIPIYYVMLM